MSNVLIEEETMKAIGKSIRGKNGESTLYKPAEMPAKIDAIEGGGSGLNIEFSQIPPTDTSKLWVKSDKKDKIFMYRRQDKEEINNFTNSWVKSFSPAFDSYLDENNILRIIFTAKGYIYNARMDTAEETYSEYNSKLNNHLRGAISNGKFYIFGLGKSFIEYDIKNNKINEKPLSIDVSRVGECIAIENTIYLFSVRDSKTAISNEIYKFNVQTNEITKLSSTLNEKKNNVRAIKYKDKILIVGGALNSPNCSNLIEEFDIKSEAIKPFCTLTEPIALPAIFLQREFLYIIAGYTEWSVEQDSVKTTNKIWEINLTTKKIELLQSKWDYSLAYCGYSKIQSLAYPNHFFVFGGGTYSNDWSFSEALLSIKVKDKLNNKQLLIDTSKPKTEITMGNSLLQIGKFYIADADNNPVEVEAYQHRNGQWVQISGGVQ